MLLQGPPFFIMRCSYLQSRAFVLSNRLLSNLIYLKENFKSWMSKARFYRSDKVRPARRGGIWGIWCSFKMFRFFGFIFSAHFRGYHFRCLILDDANLQPMSPSSSFSPSWGGYFVGKSFMWSHIGWHANEDSLKSCLEVLEYGGGWLLAHQLCWLVNLILITYICINYKRKIR